MAGLKNISLKTFRTFLKDKGLKKIRTSGGHEIWSGKDFQRPITLQSHIDPIPEFILKNSLKNMGMTKEDFIEWLKS